MGRNQEGVRYSYILSNRAKSQLKRFNNPLKLKMQECFEHISRNPAEGESLKARLEGLRSYHTKVNNVEYRIVYDPISKVDSCEIEILRVETRNDLYKKLNCSARK